MPLENVKQARMTFVIASMVEERVYNSTLGNTNGWLSFIVRAKGEEKYQ